MMGKEITFKDLVIVFLRNIRKILFITIIAVVLMLALCFYLSKGNIEVKKLIIFFILGIILGVVVGVCIFTLLYIHSPKVRSASDIRCRYNLPIFAVLNYHDTNSVKGINKIINKIEKDVVSDNTTQVEIAKQSIAIMKAQYNFIFSGSVPIDSSQLNQISNEDEKIEYYDCIIENPGMIKALYGKDGVSLIEKLNETTYERLNKQIIQIEALRKEIFGIILINA